MDRTYSYRKLVHCARKFACIVLPFFLEFKTVLKRKKKGKCFYFKRWFAHSVGLSRSFYRDWLIMVSVFL